MNVNLKAVSCDWEQKARYVTQQGRGHDNVSEHSESLNTTELQVMLREAQIGASVGGEERSAHEGKNHTVCTFLIRIFSSFTNAIHFLCGPKKKKIIQVSWTWTGWTSTSSRREGEGGRASERSSKVGV